MDFLLLINPIIQAIHTQCRDNPFNLKHASGT